MDTQKIILKQSITTNVICVFLHVLAIGTLIFGWMNTIDDATNSLHQQIYALWRNGYILLAIFYQLLALNIRLGE